MPKGDAMSQRTDLLDLFDQTRQALYDFITAIGPGEMMAETPADEWDAKDIIAMIGFWMEYMVDRMTTYARGDIPPRNVDFAEVTRQALRANADRPWGDAVARTEAALVALIQAVGDASDELLMTNNVYGAGSGDPLWEEVQANGFIWPMQQLEAYYLRLGMRERATGIRSLLTAVIGVPEVIVCEVLEPDVAAEQADAVIIDVRDAAEYAAGHVPGARNIPLGALADHLDELPHDRLVLTYCNMHHPGQSRGERAAAFLSDQGFDAAALAGGFSAWQDQDLPVAIGLDG
jgi:phage shock protein E